MSTSKLWHHTPCGARALVAAAQCYDASACCRPEYCTQGATTAQTPRSVYIENVGHVTEVVDGVEVVVQIDLRISNTSEYRSWNVNVNGTHAPSTPLRCTDHTWKHTTLASKL